MTTAKPPVEVTTTEVARLIGVPEHRLQVWAMDGRVHTDTHPGHGNRRRWTTDAVQHAAIMAQLVETLGMVPGLASRLADRAMEDVGAWWEVQAGDITVSGRTPWIPTAPDEVEP